MDPERPTRSPLPLLFGLALLHRLAVALWTTTIGADASYWLRAAEMYAGGRLDEALVYCGFHPLFPVLAATFGTAGGSIEAGGYLVSILGGSLGVVPLYFLARTCAGERVAFWTGIVYALHPILALESAEAMSTGLYVGLFIGSVALGVAALRGRNWALYPLAGLACGLTYLTRAEGALTALVFGAAAAWALRRRERREWLALLGGVATAAVCCAALVFPYVMTLSAKQGRLTITNKPAGEGFLKMFEEETPAEAIPKEERPPYLPTVAKKVVQATYWPLLPFLAAGLFLWRRRRLGGAALAGLIALALVSIAPNALLFALKPLYKASHRYYLVGMAFLYPVMALGWTAALDAFRERWGGRKWLRAAPYAFMALVLLVKSVKPRREEEASFREAGAWLRASPMKSIVSSNDKINWYGGCPPTPFSTDEPGARGEPPDRAARRLKDHVLALKADWLVLDGDSVDDQFGPEFIPELERLGFVKAASFGSTPKAVPVWIYRPRP